MSESWLVIVPYGRVNSTLVCSAVLDEGFAWCALVYKPVIELCGNLIIRESTIEETNTIDTVTGVLISVVMEEFNFVCQSLK